jgi:hypothetical protein
MKKHGVFFVGQRVAPFDHVDPHFGQPNCNIQFILQGQANPFALSSVAKRGIVRVDGASRHDDSVGGLRSTKVEMKKPLEPSS